METHTSIGIGNRCIALTREERMRHAAILGATGSGKTSLLLGLFAQDAQRRRAGILYIDPLGDDARRALDLIPKWRANQVCYFDLSDRDHPIAMNVLADVAPDERELLAENVLAGMRAVWRDSWGNRMEEILRHALRVLIELPNASIALLPRLLQDDEFRERTIAIVSNPLTQVFFGRRFAGWRDAFREEAINPVLNKIETLLFSPIVRNVLGASRSRLDLAHEMAKGRIVVANLAKGTIGESASNLLGALIIARIQSAGLARLNDSSRPHLDFHVFIDEAGDFATEAIPILLSQARHYGVSITLATQTLATLPEKTRSAMRTNPALLAAFRLSGEDAEILAPDFDRLHERANPAAFISLARGEAFVRVAGGESRLIELPPPPPGHGHGELMRRQSRRHYGSERSTVENKIDRVMSEWH